MGKTGLHFEVVSKRENPLLERMEVEGKISGYDATPSHATVIDELAKALNADKTKIHVLKIGQSYGAKQARVIAEVYSSPEALHKIVHKKRMLRTAPKTEKKAEAKKK